MNKNIIVTVEKENEEGIMKLDFVRFTKVGGQIAGCVSCKQRGLTQNHSNMIVEVTESDLCSSGKSANTRSNNNF